MGDLHLIKLVGFSLDEREMLMTDRAGRHLAGRGGNLGVGRDPQRAVGRNEHRCARHPLVVSVRY